MSQNKPITDKELIKALLQAARSIKREQIERDKTLLVRLASEIDKEENVIAKILDQD